MQHKSPQHLEQLFAKGSRHSWWSPAPSSFRPPVWEGSQARPGCKRMPRDERPWQRRSPTPRVVAGLGRWRSSLLARDTRSPARHAEAGAASARCWGHRAEALADPKQEAFTLQVRHSSGVHAGQVAGAAAGKRERADILGSANPASHSEFGSANGQSLTRPWPGLPSGERETKPTLPASDYGLHTRCWESRINTQRK